LPLFRESALELLQKGIKHGLLPGDPEVRKLEAVKIFLKAAAVAKKEEDYESMCSAYYYAAGNYDQAGIRSNAFKLYEKAINVALKHEIHDPGASCLFNAGLILKESNNYKKAIKYFLQSYDWFLKAGTEEYFLPQSLKNVADCYEELGEYKKAIEFSLKSLKWETNEIMYSITCGSIAECYINLGDYNNAVPYFLEKAKRSLRFSSPYRAAESYEETAHCYKRLGKPEKAEIFFRRALRHYEDFFKQDSTSTYTDIARCYEGLEQLGKAKELLQKSINTLKNRLTRASSKRKSEEEKSLHNKMIKAEASLARVNARIAMEAKDFQKARKLLNDATVGLEELFSLRSISKMELEETRELTEHLDEQSRHEESVVPAIKKARSRRKIRGKHVFIAYRLHAKNMARKMASYLSRNNIDVWFFPWKIGWGDSITSEEEKGIDSSFAGLIIFTPDFLEGRTAMEEYRALAAKKRQDPRFKLGLLRVNCPRELVPPFLQDYFDVEVNSDRDSKFSDVAAKILRGILGLPLEQLP